VSRHDDITGSFRCLLSEVQTGQERAHRVARGLVSNAGLRTLVAARDREASFRLCNRLNAEGLLESWRYAATAQAVWVFLADEHFDLILAEPDLFAACVEAVQHAPIPVPIITLDADDRTIIDQVRAEIAAPV
jgi:hypothetical protein